MNADATSQPGGGVMKEGSEIIQHTDPISTAAALAVTARSGSVCLKRFFGCNPFYLISAALLLYGFYLVSGDPKFLRGELSQLFFNFTALQLYEVLLVITALFLARRQIWYDSTLLVHLENLLVLVPFILISQAALVEIHWVWSMCLGAGFAALVRSSALKRFFAELNFPKRMMCIGGLVLATNVLLPVLYRILHEHKMGKLPTTGAAYMTNEFAWLLVLPSLCALANLVPAGSQEDGLLPQRSWIPAGFFSLWFVGTVVHLYCLGYVYDFPLRRELLAPVIWVLLWTFAHRAKEPMLEIGPFYQRAILILPLLATLIGISQPGNEVFLFLSILDVAIYAGISIEGGDRLARHLLLISSLALIAGMPEDWGRSLIPHFNHHKCIGASTALYFLFWAAISPNPKLGVFGALALGLTVMALLGTPIALHWGIQTGFAFLLVHSLRWADNQHEGTGAVRLLACLGWVAHNFWWMHDGGALGITCTLAGPVLVIYFLARWLRGKWGSPLIPIAAAATMLSWPGDWAAGTIRSTPVGLVAVIASFLLFAAGTCAAVTKHRWLH